MKSIKHKLSEARCILLTHEIKRLVQSINWSSRPQLSEVTCAARLTHHGFLRSVNGLSLWNLDLSSVPTGHLASLFSCVTGGVYIAYVSGCDLSPILDSLKCKTLEISSQRLNTRETQVGVVDYGIWKNRTGRKQHYETVSNKQKQKKR